MIIIISYLLMEFQNIVIFIDKWNSINFAIREYSLTICKNNQKC